MSKLDISLELKKKPPQSIIVRMPNWVGDFVMATPVLECLKTKWKESTLTVCCAKGLGQLLIGNPFVDEVIEFKKPSGWVRKLEHYDIISPLQRGNYDLGIVLTNSFSSAYWFWRAGIHPLVGYTGHLRKWLLDKAVLYPLTIEKDHLVLTYQKLLIPLGIPLEPKKPSLFVKEEELLQTRNFLKGFGVDLERDILIGMNPGAAYGSAKCWPKERFQLLTEKLLQNERVKIIYFGDANGASLVRDICSHFPLNVIDLAGKTSLRELLSYISLCNLFLTNDSGPMHIAAALKVPLLAIFGSTSDVKTGPYLSGEVIHKYARCSPCYLKECPIDFRCMTRISVEEVYHKIKNKLGL